ncbi:MAG: CAP domain-containing protein [Gaiellaceae bacterium]
MAVIAVAPATAASLTSPERALLQQMNSTRAAHGLGPMAVDWKLQSAARAHAADMLRRDYFSHGPFLSRILSYGPKGPMFGENLAWGAGASARPAAIVRSWLASPGHRAVLLRPGFRRVGVAAPTGNFRGVANARVVAADFAGV